MPFSMFLFVSWCKVSVTKHFLDESMISCCLFSLFVWFWTSYGLSETPGLPLHVQQYLSSFLQEWSISWSRTLGYDHRCISVPVPHHSPYFLGLLLNGWVFAFLGNVLLVAGHDPFNIIQCSIHIFSSRTVLFKCVSESFWGKHSVLFLVII